MIVHRFPPKNRGASSERVSLDFPTSALRRNYMSMRRNGDRPFDARLALIGLHCQAVSS